MKKAELNLSHFLSSLDGIEGLGRAVGVGGSELPGPCDLWATQSREVLFRDTRAFTCDSCSPGPTSDCSFKVSC